MPTIYLETSIEAPIERCFDLALSVDLHQLSVEHTQERPVAGVMSGVMRLGDTVTWEAVHFGVRQHLTTQITAYERPYHFTDEMLRGAFHSLKHVHEFRLRPTEILMVDQFSFRAPLGPLGWIAGRLVLTRYMRRLLLTRNQFLKQLAEAGADPANPGQWPSLLPHSSMPA
jgi:ligand-binding SRPBCC domain-containing protein